MLTDGGLRRRGEDRLRQAVAVDQSGRQRQAAHGTGRSVVEQTGSGEVSPRHGFHRQHAERHADHRPPPPRGRDQRIVHGQQVIRNDVGQALEPPRGHRGEDPALVRDRAVEHVIEGGDAVAGHDEQSTVGQPVQIADLAAVHVRRGRRERHRAGKSPADPRRGVNEPAPPSPLRSRRRRGRAIAESETGPRLLRPPGLQPQRRSRRSPPPVRHHRFGGRGGVAHGSSWRGGSIGRRCGDADTGHDGQYRCDAAPESNTHYVPFVRFAHPREASDATKFGRVPARTPGNRELTNRIDRQHRVIQTRQLAASCLAPTRGRRLWAISANSPR